MTGLPTERIALITGSTDGIGKQTALEMARRGYQVLVHGRSRERGQEALADLQRQVPAATFDLVIADLASLAQIRTMANDIIGRIGHLDVLINNAGVKPLQREVTKDGFELTFGVNHLAHFALTTLLLDTLRKAAQGRIVTVSSVAHTRGKMHFDDLQLERGWDSYTAYAQSKLANVLFAFGLARRLQGGTVTSNAVHPGVVTTKLLVVGFGATGGSLEDGAATSVYVATAPELADANGEFFGNMRREKTAPLALDQAQQDRLRQISADLAGLA